MEGQIEQGVCIKFSVKFRKAATEIFEILREAFGEHSFSPTMFSELFSPFKAS
jgi:hypothetical protein